MVKEGFVPEYAVEGGAADGKLAGGAELVTAVEVKDVLDVMTDDGVEGKAVGLAGRALVELNVGFDGQGKIAREDDAVVSLEECGFEDAGEFADVAWPVVLKEPGEGAGTEEHGALLIAGADAVKQGLGERSDVFAALTQRRNGEADRGEAEGEVGEKKSLTCHLPQRCL